MAQKKVDPVETWLNDVAVFLMDRGAVLLSALGESVPRPENFNGTLSSLLKKDSRFRISKDSAAFTVSLERTMEPEESKVQKAKIHNSEKTNPTNLSSKGKNAIQSMPQGKSGIQPPTFEKGSAKHDPRSATGSAKLDFGPLLSSAPPLTGLAAHATSVQRSEVACKSVKNDYAIQKSTELRNEVKKEIENHISLSTEATKQLEELQLRRQKSERELAEILEQVTASRKLAEEESRKVLEEVKAAKQAKAKAEVEFREGAASIAALRRTAQEQMTFFRKSCDGIIQRHGYLIYGELEQNLHRHIGDSRNWCHKLLEHCNALRHMLKAVEGTIDAMLATHTAVTLYDIMDAIMNLRDFEEFDNFEDLNLGSLLRNRKVEKYFRLSQLVLDRGEVPEITTAEVLRALAKEMGPDKLLCYKSESRDPSELRQLIRSVLDEFARSKGYQREEDLCLFMKGESFVIFLTSRASVHAKMDGESFERQLSRAKSRAEKHAMTEAFATSIAEFSDQLQGDAFQDMLRAGRLWRAMQSGVYNMPADKALLVIRQLLLRLPEVWKMLDAMKVLQKDPEGSKLCANALRSIGYDDWSSGDSNGKGAEDEDEDAVKDRECCPSSGSGTQKTDDEDEDSEEYEEFTSSSSGEDSSDHASFVRRRSKPSAMLGWAATFCALLKENPRDDGSHNTITVGGNRQLKVSDRVVLVPSGLNARNFSDEMKGIEQRIKEDPTKRAKLTPRLVRLRDLFQAHGSSNGLQAVEAGDVPLRYDEVGLLVKIDDSSVPFLVRTGDGNVWWYEKKTIMLAPESSMLAPGCEESVNISGGFTRTEAQRLIDSIAPIIVCAMKKIPLHSSYGDVLEDFDIDAAGQALKEYLTSNKLSIGLTELEALSKAEAIFTSTYDEARNLPSLLRFLCTRSDFREMVCAPMHVKGDEARTFALNSGNLFDESKVVDIVRSSFGESFNRGNDVLFALTHAEKLIHEIYEVKSFSTLPTEVSFLEFCRMHRAQLPLLEKMIRSTKEQSLPCFDPGHRRRVLEVAYLAMRRPPNSADAERCKHIVRVIERHFGRSFASLGFDSADEALTELNSVKPSQELIAAAHSLLWQGASGEELSKESKAIEALKDLKEAPYLIDLAEWTSWDRRYFCDLGSLRDFAEESWKVEGKNGKWRLLEVRHGQCVKIPSRASLFDFANAVQQYDPLGAAAICISLAVDDGSVSALKAKFELMRRQIEECLVRATPLEAAGFVFAAAASIPQPLRVDLALPLFIEPLLGKVPDAERILAQRCQTSADRATLRQIGLASGRKLWAGAENLVSNDAGTACVGASSPGQANLIRRQGSSMQSPESCTVSNSDPVYDGCHPSILSQAADSTPFLHPEGVCEHTSDVHPHTLAICRRIQAIYGLEPGLAPPTEAMQDLVNNSIRRLAAELYAKEVHFILELIQNCDDNPYAEGVVPSLAIEIAADRLTFSNNEVGFSEENIVAISTIGKSTKAAKAGYIGQKGIGFKSVFKVAQRPQVHSRTFHFEFNSDGESTSGLAYIIPQPLPTPAGWDESYGTTIILPFKSDGGADRESRCGRVVDRVRADVYKIDRSLLLFLNRLCRLDIVDVSQPGRRNARSMLMREQSGGIVCIEEHDHTGRVTTERWLVTNRSLHPEICRTEKSERSQEGDLTCLSIAIPLVPPTQLGLGESSLPAREVFAFLPLRSYGFRWVLQGDFVLPSARESVDASNAWNQRLLLEVPSLFLEAALDLVGRAQRAAKCSLPPIGDTINEKVPSQPRSDGNGGLESSHGGDSDENFEQEQYFLKLLFAMVPLQGQASEFFADVPREILTLLRGSPIIPVTGGRFMAPPAAVQLPPSTRGMDHDEYDRLNEYTGRVLACMGLQFVRRDSGASPELLRQLGVNALSDLLCDVLSCAAAGWAHSGTDTNIATTFAQQSGGVKLPAGTSIDAEDNSSLPPPPAFSSEWVIHMLAALEASADVEMRMAELRQLAIFPLAGYENDGKRVLVPLSDNVFEVEDACCAEDLASIADAAGNHRLGLQVLCPEFRALLVGTAPARLLARRMGLRSLKSEDFVVGHLIPAMAVSGTPPAALVRLLALIKRLACAVPSLQGGRLQAEMLRVKVLLVDGAGNGVCAGTPLHFLPCYSVIPNIRAADVLPQLKSDGVDSVSPLITEAAVDCGDAAEAQIDADLKGVKGNADGCLAFLVDPDFDPRWPTISPAYIALDGDTAGWAALLRGLGVAPFAHVDAAPPYASPDFELLLSSTVADAAGAETAEEWGRLQRVAQALSAAWASEYAALAAAADTAGCEDQSFLELLRRRRWVPTENKRLLAPTEVFDWEVKDAREVLGGRAAFAASSGLQGAAAAALKVRRELIPGHVVEALRSWSAASSAPVIALNFIAGVYKYLARHMASASTDASEGIAKELQSFRSVFVPNRTEVADFGSGLKSQKVERKHYKDVNGDEFLPLRADTEVGGVWLRPENCVWSDPSHLMDSLRLWKPHLTVSQDEHDLATEAANCRALKDYYERLDSELLQQYFCGTGGRGLGVRRTPSDDRYLDIWQAVGELRPPTRHSVASALRVIVHFTYEHSASGRYRDDEDEEEVDGLASDGTCSLSLTKAIARRARRLYVPNARGQTLTALERLHWIADPAQDLEAVDGQFDASLLEHCAPLRHGGLHSIEDASDSRLRGHAEQREDRVLIAKLDKQMQYFYREVLRLPRLKDSITLRVVGCDPLARAVSNASSQPGAGFAICHVAARMMQTWANSAPFGSGCVAGALTGRSKKANLNADVDTTIRQERMEELADAVRKLTVRILPAPGKVRIARCWVAEHVLSPSVAAAATAAGGDGGGVRFESSIQWLEASCAMDIGASDEGPTLVGCAPGPPAWTAEDLATAFAQLVPGGPGAQASALSELRPILMEAYTAAEELSAANIDNVISCPADPWLAMELLAPTPDLPTDPDIQTPPEAFSPEQAKAPPQAMDLLSNPEFQRRLRESAAQAASLEREVRRAAAAAIDDDVGGGLGEGGSATAIQTAIESRRAFMERIRMEQELGTAAPLPVGDREAPSTTYALGPFTSTADVITTGRQPPPRLFEEVGTAPAQDLAAIAADILDGNGSGRLDFGEENAQHVGGDGQGSRADYEGTDADAVGGGYDGCQVRHYHVPFHLRWRVGESGLSAREIEGVADKQTGNYGFEDGSIAEDVWVTEEELVEAAREMAPSLPTQGGIGEDVVGTGRWGEELVYHLLKRAINEGGTLKDELAEVIWVNEKSESGFPYDILIRRRRRQHSLDQEGRESVEGLEDEGNEGLEDGGNEEVVEVEDEFVEVKSTRMTAEEGAWQQPFSLSVNELLFALKAGPRFQVYRVFGALSGSPARVLAIPDLAGRLRTARVLCDVTAVSPPSPP